MASNEFKIDFKTVDTYSDTGGIACVPPHEEIEHKVKDELAVNERFYR